MTRSLTLQAQVKDSTLQLSGDQRERMAQFIAKHEDKFITITLRQSGKPRSLNQNAYLWGIVYQLIAEHTGHTEEEVHEFMKMAMLPRKFIEIGHEEFAIAKSTASLNTTEFAEYVDKVVAFAATELCLTIPSPNARFPESPVPGHD